VLLISGVEAAPETTIRVYDKVLAFGIATAFGTGRAAGLDSPATRRTSILKEIELEGHISPL
jgi:hypothetical protein